MGEVLQIRPCIHSALPGAAVLGKHERPSFNAVKRSIRDVTLENGVGKGNRKRPAPSERERKTPNRTGAKGWKMSRSILVGAGLGATFGCESIARRIARRNSLVGKSLADTSLPPQSSTSPSFPVTCCAADFPSPPSQRRYHVPRFVLPAAPSPRGEACRQALDPS